MLKCTRLARMVAPSTAGIGGVTMQHCAAMNTLALVALSRYSSGGSKVQETLAQYSASSRIC